MKNFNQKVVVITGAASGLGRALALELAKEGALLAISDINEHELKQTAESLKALNAEPLVTILDVSNKQAMDDWAKQVADHFGGVHAIINNAGVVIANPIDKVPHAQFEWLMNINFWGVVYGVTAFMPYLAKQEESHIVNVSSIVGILPIPMMVAYASSKFAVRGYTEGLRMELMHTHPSIHVTGIYPCAIKTNILENAQGEDIPKIQQMFVSKYTVKINADVAAKLILKAIKKKKARALVGPHARRMDLLSRIIPNSYHKLVSAIHYLILSKSS